MTPTPLLIVLWALGLLPLLFLPWLEALGPLVLAYDVGLLVWMGVDLFVSARQAPFELERHTPPTLTQHHPAQIELRLQNLQTTPQRIFIRDHIPDSCTAEPAILESSLRGREKRTFHYLLTPQTRGDATFGSVHLRYTTRFGLFYRHRRFGSTQPIAIFPPLHMLKKYDMRANTRRMSQEGLHLLRRRGRGSEFERLREYTPDDEYRDINWKATAKRHKPISQVYQAERSQDVMLVLDIGRTMGATIGDRRKLDVAIEAILLLCHIAQRFDDRFGLLLYSHRPECFLPPKKGSRHFQRVLRALYNLEPLPYDVQYRELFRFLATQHRKRSLIVFFTDLGDEEAAEHIQRHMPLLIPTHLPLCISIADPSIKERATQTPASPDALYQRAAAMEMLQSREVLLRSLRQRGVLFLDRPPEELSPATIQQYLEIKTRHRL